MGSPGFIRVNCGYGSPTYEPISDLCYTKFVLLVYDLLKWTTLSFLNRVSLFPAKLPGPETS